MSNGYDVFLGGTTNKSTWRNVFIDLMDKENPNVKCFNPVVPEWNEEARELENFIKANVKYHVYVFTPRMLGVYSVAELIQSAYDKSKCTYMCILDKDIDPEGNLVQWYEPLRNSLDAVIELVAKRKRVHLCESLHDIVKLISDDYNSTPKESSSNIDFSQFRGIGGF